MNTNSIIETLEQNVQASAAIRSQLVNRKLIPLPAQVIDGIHYDAPEGKFSVHRETGGAALGVVGKTYAPVDLNRFYDVIEQSVIECGGGLKASDITYKEYYGGAKIAFEIPLKSLLLDSGLHGDVIDCKLQMFTGFDGLTMSSMNLWIYRQFCANGAKAWMKDAFISFKNTVGNSGKELLLCNEIFTGLQGVETYVKKMNELATRKITREEVKQFVSKLTGYDMETESKKQKNILNKLLADIETEMQSTDLNAFSLLQGVTRYTSHTLAKNEESQIFGSAAKMNAQAMELVSLY